MIIPIFISHMGCPHDCVFCNQRKITSKEKPVTIEEARKTIEAYLSGAQRETYKELAFYGGSFTAIPIEEQNKYLNLAKEYKDKGLIDGIHLSTRPDAINCQILDNLKIYGVDVIELGVQSFDNKVLKDSARGHFAEDALAASALIKEYGFDLGIQLMVGLPGDTLEKDVYSAMETVKVAPKLARIYPTIVIEDTALYDLYKAGRYKPLSVEEAVVRSCEIYKILYNADIKIMRVGLKSSPSINEGGDIAGDTFHPAFRQLVEGRLMRQIAEKLICEFMERTQSEAGETDGSSLNNKVTEPDESSLNHGKVKGKLYTSPKWFSNLVGNGKENKIYLGRRFPKLDLRYQVDECLDEASVCFVAVGYRRKASIVDLPCMMDES